MLRVLARLRVRASVRAAALATPVLLAVFAAGCGAIPFEQQPAHDYAYGTGAPLRVAVIDEAGGPWSAPLAHAMQTYASAASPYLQFQSTTAGAHIVITVKAYTDGEPPQLEGYDFPQGAGGFATIYDAEGAACNYPPSPLPLNCTGEITTAQIWLNEAIPTGGDMDARRTRLITHELGHSLGLTRHSAELDIFALRQRYGWPD
jgi:hypothetical protein